MAALEFARIPVLEIAYYSHGRKSGWPVVLTHGFPYDVHAYDSVVPILVNAGARVITPYIRGFGPTRFLSDSTMRTGEQAAIGSDLIALLDSLGIEKAILGGFDWGGAVSCTAAALWPERVVGLVSYAGYDIVSRSSQSEPQDPELEYPIWYQYLFQTERGRKCLANAEYRRKLSRMLWEQWSPTWRFTDETFDQTAKSFDNPDFTDIVIHAYRFCMGNEEGDPTYKELEERLARKPTITVPTITLDGKRDPLKVGGTAHHAPMFTGKHEHRTYDVGHAFPAEAPEAFAEAILTIRRWMEQEAECKLIHLAAAFLKHI